ncbi:Uncharacterised protein [Mycobacteroides abscessus subsp. abscessus]|nr:Uncharacterised protein [Mycobacteroides abscessus subsp. abscessus]SIN57556.1 Uncharacterised protein [Mycobacteroides abscessus subsp. abscessus]SLE59065.1 Uncharacterised protein [Mycobacteroides abscessus subsp. massiliense]
MVIRKHSSSGFQYRMSSSRMDPELVSAPVLMAANCSSLSDSSMVRRSQYTTIAATPPMAKAMRQPNS